MNGRKKNKRKIIDAAAIIVAAVVFIAVFASCGSNNAGSSSAGAPGSSNGTAQASQSGSGSDLKVFSKAELAKYDGQNGNPAYVAIDGKVYDVTNAPKWHNGTHQGYKAGQDLTDAINASPHGTSVLDSLKVVGTYSGK